MTNTTKAIDLFLGFNVYNARFLTIFSPIRFGLSLCSSPNLLHIWKGLSTVRKHTQCTSYALLRRLTQKQICEIQKRIKEAKVEASAYSIWSEKKRTVFIKSDQPISLKKNVLKMQHNKTKNIYYNLIDATISLLYIYFHSKLLKEISVLLYY